MKNPKIKFVFQNTEKLINSLEMSLLKEEQIKMRECFLKWYTDERSSINLPFNEEILSSCLETHEKIKDATMMIVVGIGGSNLGSLAIYEAIKWKFANEINLKKIYFADTTDEDYIKNILNIAQKELKTWWKIAINAISKSGSTTETIANYNIFLDFLQNNQEDWQKYIIITTGKNSKFYNYWKENNFHILEIQDIVGWRFSVFSTVGIFPLIFGWINVKELLKWAQDSANNSVLWNPETSEAILWTLDIWENYKNNKGIVNNFFWSNQLESVGKWQRQLMWESLGKEYNKSWSKKIKTGLTPTVSIWSTDLHSMAQLYFGWPNDKYHVLVYSTEDKKLILKKNNSLEKIIENLNNISIAQIMEAIIYWTKWALENNEVPYSEVIFDKIDEYNIGYYLQTKMIEMMYFWILFDVNTFDQPNVEDYKKIMKEKLG